jgi:hypothetical protein
MSHVFTQKYGIIEDHHSQGNPALLPCNKMMHESTLPHEATWLSNLVFHPSKCTPGYVVSSDALTATLSTGRTYQTVQSIEPLTKGRWYFDVVFQGLVGGIGSLHLVNPAQQINIYNDNSFLLSGYGDLNSFSGSIKLSKNISRSTGMHYCALLDMDAGELTYWLDRQQLQTVKHESLKSGKWFVTATFGSGVAGASFRITI